MLWRKLGVQFLQATFKGELAEVPEPSTAVLLGAGILIVMHVRHTTPN